MANKNITQLTLQTGSADPTSLFYTVVGSNSDKSLPLNVFVNNLGLTGTPTAPTATAGTNTTQIASTAYVQTALGSYAPLSNPVFTGTIGGGSASISLGGMASFSSIQGTPIGTTSGAAGTFTNLTANTTLVVNGTLSGSGVSTYLASPPGIGATTPSTGAFTTLSASSTVSGTGFSTYLASPPAIGSTTASTGKFTTLQTTSAYTPSSTAGIVGTATNDNANAGSWGEYQTATGSSTGLTSGSYVDIVTLSLGAGDWDILGSGSFNPAASTVPAALQIGVNTVANTSPPLGAITLMQLTFTTGAAQIITTPVVRVSLASTTTVRVGAQANFTVSTMNATGFIRARRVR
jgi:hypothetical protein